MRFKLGRKSKRFSLAKKTPQYKKAQQIRGSRRWQKLRAVVRAENPLCMFCRKAPTSDIHHIEEVAKRPELAFELANLIPVCVKCHEDIHKRMVNGEDLKSELLSKKEAYKGKKTI